MDMDVFAPEFVRQSRPDLGIDEQVRLLELIQLQNDESPAWTASAAAPR
ncbi:hypothetical protein [Streptomyces mirabilis]